MSGNYQFIQGEVNLVLPENISVNTNKIYLECKTSIGACLIRLPKISSAKTWGFWIYINDFDRLASVNNIIVNVDSENSINGESSIVLNVNGATAILYIASDRDWAFSSNVEGGTIPEAEGVAVNFTAGENIGGQRVVIIKTGLAFLFDPESVDDVYNIVGVSKNAASTNDTVKVIQTGLMTSAGSFVQDDTYYAGIGGVLTATIPSSGVVLKIGHAETNNRLIIAPSVPVVAV